MNFVKYYMNFVKYYRMYVIKSSWSNGKYWLYIADHSDLKLHRIMPGIGNHCKSRTEVGKVFTL